MMEPTLSERKQYLHRALRYARRARRRLVREILFDSMQTSMVQPSGAPCYIFPHIVLHSDVGYNRRRCEAVMLRVEGIL